MGPTRKRSVSIREPHDQIQIQKRQVTQHTFQRLTIPPPTSPLKPTPNHPQESRSKAHSASRSARRNGQPRCRIPPRHPHERRLRKEPFSEWIAGQDASNVMRRLSYSNFCCTLDKDAMCLSIIVAIVRTSALPFVRARVSLRSILGTLSISDAKPRKEFRAKAAWVCI